eukprot:3873605-Pyramimonas_sp.AAC.1
MRQPAPTNHHHGRRVGIANPVADRWVGWLCAQWSRQFTFSKVGCANINESRKLHNNGCTT